MPALLLQRGRTWQEALAAVFSWALGQSVEACEVDACFHQSEGTVLKVDKDRLAALGALQNWQMAGPNAGQALAW